MSGRTVPLQARIDDVLRIASILTGEGIGMIGVCDDAVRNRFLQIDAMLGVVLGAIEHAQAEVPDKLTQDEDLD